MNEKTPETLAHAAYSELCALAESNDGDIEINHARADEILCDLISNLGYPLVAEAFNRIEKWYS